RRTLVADSFAGARSFAAWKEHVTSNWWQVAVGHVESGGVDAVPEVGDELHVRVPVHLGALSPSDVRVQVVYGRTHETDVLLDTQSIDLVPADAPQGQSVEFTGTLPLTRAGSFGYNVRVVPHHTMLNSVAEMGLVAFGQ
ncbi:MAG TPA: DUF3417 domain-containing protein, partial [Terrimesophilobacter sp.]|nr:DUF3417 domain-containing protein [Terrimesophilobacter sp.]